MSAFSVAIIRLGGQFRSYAAAAPLKLGGIEKRTYLLRAMVVRAGPE